MKNVVDDPTIENRTIKRLSIYEKRLLVQLWEYRTDKKFSGIYVSIKKLRKDICMPHRSSMTRLIKTLEMKGLILTHKKNSKHSGKPEGQYTKLVSSTPEGNHVGYWMYNEDLWPNVDIDEG